MTVYDNPRKMPHRQWGAEKIFYLSNYLLRRKFRIAAYFFKYLNMLIFRNYIPPEVNIGQRLDLPHGGFGVIMHRDTTIGDDAVILHNVTIADGNVTIGHRVYIGANSTILGPLSIGDDVTIGANTFVNFNVPSNATVVGQKGKII